MYIKEESNRCILCSQETERGVCTDCLKFLPVDIKTEHPIEYILLICPRCQTYSYCHFNAYTCPVCHEEEDDLAGQMVDLVGEWESYYYN